jgi:hypothetical protein
MSSLPIITTSEELDTFLMSRMNENDGFVDDVARDEVANMRYCALVFDERKVMVKLESADTEETHLVIIRLSHKFYAPLDSYIRARVSNAVIECPC